MNPVSDAVLSGILFKALPSGYLESSMRMK